MASIQIKRGTRAQISAAAAASGLKEGELYFVTDEDRVDVGAGASSSVALAKLSEVGGGGGSPAELPALATIDQQTLLGASDLATKTISTGAGWQTHTGVPAGEWYSVCYGNGLFVAVQGSEAGAYPFVMTSVDGKAWTTRSIPAGVNPTAVCFGGGTFVATLGLSSSVLVSTDGIAWVEQTTGVSAHDWFDVCFAAGQFVAVANSFSSTPIMTSPDGEVWTARTSPTPYLLRVAYGAGRFLSIGNEGAVYSLDGITWLAAGAAPTDYAFSTVGFGAGVFVATAFDTVGDPPGADKILTSPDGAVWTERTSPISDALWERVVYGGGCLLLLSGGGDNARVASSVDGGVTWVAQASAGTTGRWTAGCFGAEKFVLLQADAATSCMTSTTSTQLQPKLVSGENIKTVNGASILGSGNIVISGGGGSGDVVGPSSSQDDRLVTFSGTTGKVIKGATHFDIPSGGIPAAPAAGNLRTFARSRAGRVLPHIIGPSGIDVALQPALFGNSIYMWLPGTGTTLSVAFGTSFTARNNGTGAAQAHPTKTSTNAMTSLNRATFSTGTTAGGTSGVQSSATVAWRGNAPGLGGFFFFSRFGVESMDSTTRFMVGLTTQNAVMGADPSSFANSVLLVKDTADTQWFVSTRNASTGTKTSTGLTVTAGQVLDFTIFCAPNDSKITVRLVDAVTGTVYMDNVDITATLPVNTVFMYMWAGTQANGSTTARLLGLNRLYLETDL